MRGRKSSLHNFSDFGFGQNEICLSYAEILYFWCFQAAQDVALSTGDTSFILKLLETAGDIFLNSCRDRDKAVIFYRVLHIRIMS